MARVMYGMWLGSCRKSLPTHFTFYVSRLKPAFSLTTVGAMCEVERPRANGQAQNEFAAAQEAQYPTHFVGFLSVDPHAESAIDEVRHWRGSRQLIGLKLHFTASAVDVRNAGQRARLAKVISVAAAAGQPMVIILVRATSTRRR
jgi:predicted TIM-barrel fold metal-dependent hydrolase